MTEILCTRCGAETFLKREPVYEGLAKTGERLFCVACGFEYASEADVPFKPSAPGPAIFSEDDRPETPKLFAEGEGERICRHCAEYVVNPFTQFCSRRRREVQATDSCPDFTSISP